MRFSVWVGVLAFSLIPPTFLLTEIYEHATNTLAANGHWDVTKATLERSVSKAEYFRDTRAALSRDRLDMGVWFSPHEIVYHDPLSIAQIRFRAFLDPDAYLVAEFDRGPSGFSALRLSRSRLFPSAFLQSNSEGKFSRRDLIRIPPIEEGWNDFEILQENGKLALLINRTRVFETAFEGLPSQRFGFVNGRHRVLLQDISVTSPTGQIVASENFRNTRNYILVFLASLGILLLINRGISWKTRKDDPIFSVLAFNVGLIVCLSLFFAADWYYFSSKIGDMSRVPPPPPGKYRSWIHQPPVEAKIPGTSRILFLGNSQTWGLGATRAQDAWVNRIQLLLDGAHPSLGRFQTLNGGWPGDVSQDVLDRYQKDWIEKQPDFVVVDLSCGDEDPKKFRENLTSLAKFNRSRGIKTLFILEPNNIEDTDSLLDANHEAMLSVGAAFGIPVVDMHSYLRSKDVYDSGLLWWDYDHLTSYGQELFARYLFPRLKELLAAQKSS